MFFSFYQPSNFHKGLKRTRKYCWELQYGIHMINVHCFTCPAFSWNHYTLQFFSGSCVFYSICPINCGQRHNVLFTACAAREWIICTTVTLAPMAIWNHLIVWWIAASFWKSQIMVWQASVLLVKMKTHHMHCMLVRIFKDFLFWRMKHQLTFVLCC